MPPRRSFLERLVDSALDAASSLLEGVGKGAERVQEVLAAPPPRTPPPRPAPPARGPRRRLQTPRGRQIAELQEENRQLRELVNELLEEVRGPAPVEPPRRPPPAPGPQPRYPRIWDPNEGGFVPMVPTNTPNDLGMSTLRRNYINRQAAVQEYQEIVGIAGAGYVFLVQRSDRRFELHVYQGGQRPVVVLA